MTAVAVRFRRRIARSRARCGETRRASASRWARNVARRRSSRARDRNAVDARAVGHHRVRARRSHAHRARRHDARRNPRGNEQARSVARAGSARLRRRHARRHDSHGVIRSASLLVRRAARSRAGRGVRHRRWSGRARRRARREERGRLRSHAAAHRIVGNARRDNGSRPCACTRAPRPTNQSPWPSTRRPACRACGSCCDDFRSRRTRARSSTPSSRRSSARRDTTALFRLGGNSESVRAQRDALAELGDTTEVDGGVWRRLATAEPEHAMVFRLSALPTAIEGVWSQAMSVAATCPGTLIHAAPARGVVRCIVPRSDAAIDALRRHFVESADVQANRRAAARRAVGGMRAAADGRPAVGRNQANVRSKSLAEYRNPRRARVSAPVVVPPECALPNSPLAQEKAGIDACVHCGFCLQSCPTYLTLEDENDSPRGRIVLMRALLEGTLAPGNESVETHIAQCLGCRACETVCPSGVPYGHLLEATRATLAEHRPIPGVARVILVGVRAAVAAASRAAWRASDARVGRRATAFDDFPGVRASRWRCSRLRPARDRRRVQRLDPRASADLSRCSRDV